MLTPTIRIGKVKALGPRSWPKWRAHAALTGGRLHNRLSSRRVIASILAFGALTPVGIGLSGEAVAFTLLLLSTLAASAITPDLNARSQALPSNIFVNLPMGFLAILFSAIAGSLVFSLVLDGRVEIDRPSAILYLSSLVLVWWSFSVARGGKIGLVRGDRPAVLGGGIVLLIGMITVLIQPFQIWSRAVASSTDFVRHLIMMRDFLDEGGLNYSISEYPRGFHALLGVAWAASGADSFEDAWRAMEASAWLMLSLLAICCTFAAKRGLKLAGAGGGLQDWIVSLITIVALLQSMWLSSMFRMGFMTSIAAGLVLASILSASAALNGRWLGTRNSFVWTCVALACMANIWTLLIPTLLGLCALILFIAVREHGLLLWVNAKWLTAMGLGFCALLVAAAPLYALFQVRFADDELVGDLSASGVSGLVNPNSWWLMVALLAIVASVRQWREGAVPYVLGSVVTAFTGVAVVLVIARTGAGQPWALNYYAGKTAWTYWILVVPLAIAGAAWLCLSIWGLLNRQRPGLRRSSVMAVFCGVLIVLSAGVLGRMSGTPSEFLSAIRSGFGVISVQLPVVSALEESGLKFEESQPIVVWGIIPNATSKSLNSVNTQFADLVAMESTAWLGTDSLDGSAVRRAPYGRRVEIVCQYLYAHPHAVRLTGPNPEAGAQWLIDSGCPTDVVRPDEWISVQIDESWFAGTDLTRKPYIYPTYDEYKTFIEEQSSRSEH